MVNKINFENLHGLKLENQYLSAVIAYELGGKVVSLLRKDKKFELLFQNKEYKYKKPKLYDQFQKFDAAGFDDAFPAINRSVVRIGDEEVIYPDHGEIWSACFNYEIKDDRIILNYKSNILPYDYTKMFYLNGNRLVCEYKIRNNGILAFPCIWAFHCLVRFEEDMMIVFPRGTEEIENVLESYKLGAIGEVYKYPEDLDINGNLYDFSSVPGLESNSMEKYYLKGKAKEGVCGIYYPLQNIAFNIYFDKEKLPYVGFWVTAGAFRGDYNCALEPTNGYYDSIDIAEKKQALFTLAGGTSLEFKIEMELK